VTALFQNANTGRNNRNPIFVIFDLFGDPNNHDVPPMDMRLPAMFPFEGLRTPLDRKSIVSKTDSLDSRYLGSIQMEISVITISERG
jgi:hypothetical protein